MGPAIVAIVTVQHAYVPTVLIGQRLMHVPPCFLTQRLQLARQALALRLVLHDEPSVPCPSAVMREAEEREGVGPPQPALLPSLGREAAELNQTRFVLVQCQ